MNYKNTLNLPITSFSMKADLKNKEVNILTYWNNINIYNNQNIKKKIFTIIDGPPYANGNIHIGHAFNKIIKDIIFKFKNLSGYHVKFIPGWDCHGLPIELNVEKSLKNRIINNIDFRNLCKDYALKQINIQKISFIRLGIISGWNDHYTTMNKFFEANIIETFKSLIINNYIYKGLKPIYWCFDCSSALADAEIEYFNKKSDSIYVAFKFVNSINLLDNNNNIYFLVWTTTPWTLPFNQAIAINITSNYVLLKYNKKFYIFNLNLFDDLSKKFKFKKHNIIKYFKGNIFENCNVKHPFIDKTVRIVFSEHVKSDSGTGCVHIAPAYGYDDYNIAKKYNLEIQNNIDDKGYVYSTLDSFNGKNINEINSYIIYLSKKYGNLLLSENINHRYPHCWRHKTPVIFRTTNQWFLNVSNKELKNQCLKISKKIDWIPNFGEKKIISMLVNRPDWCLSRQRTWGVPIMLFYNKYNYEIHPNSINILNEIITKVKTHGTDFWYNNDIFSLFNIDTKIYDKCDDVLDVWYDSSSVYKFFIDKYGIENFPFDICVEGNDQYRGWFQVSILNSVTNFNINPFKKIIAHGFVLDSLGRKMSKSLNNVIDPLDIVKEFGADILRLWVASNNYCFDVNISQEILNRICDSYRKIRNTFRFLLSNVENNLEFIKDKNMILLDRWILNKFMILKNYVIHDYNIYKFFYIYKRVYNFLDDIGYQYLEIIKDRIYTYNKLNFDSQSAQSVSYYILYNLIKIMSPILSFTSEEIWEKLPIKEKKSIFFSTFNLCLPVVTGDIFITIKELILVDKLFILKSYLNKIIELFRHKNSIKSSLDIEIFIYCNLYWFNLLKKLEFELKFFFIISNFKLFRLEKKYDNDYKLVNGIFVKINISNILRCERCWNKNIVSKYLSICERCLNNIYYTTNNKLFF
jgi:isoleucyl-tRNA synthetase